MEKTMSRPFTDRRSNTTTTRKSPTVANFSKEKGLESDERMSLLLRRLGELIGHKLAQEQLQRKSELR
jgi:hypothetical protein